MLLIPGLEREEFFSFENNMEIVTDYCFTNPNFPNNFKKIISGGQRATADLRRSKLYKDGILISESIENNPNYLSLEEIDRLNNEGKFIGEEFERTINFHNGYVAKIRYENSKNNSDPNLGIYRSKFRRMMLLNENNQIIADVIQENPNFGKTPYNKEAETRLRSKGIFV